MQLHVLAATYGLTRGGALNPATVIGPSPLLRVKPSCTHRRYILRLLLSQGVEFWAVNTDAQALAAHPAPNKIQVRGSRQMRKCIDAWMGAAFWHARLLDAGPVMGSTVFPIWGHPQMSVCCQMTNVSDRMVCDVRRRRSARA